MHSDLVRIAALGADPDETEMVDAIVDSIDRYASDHIDAERIDAEGEVPRKVIEDLADLGLFGVSIPEEWGGAGFSQQGVCSVVAALARHDRSTATTVGLHLGLGTRGLVEFGPDALREQYLPDLAAGSRLAAFAATEAGAGSDLKRIATRAVEVDGRLRVNGTKIFVTNGALAGVYTILAASPGLGGARRGQSLVLLDRADRGLEVGAEEHKLGLRGSSTTTVNLDDLDLPLDRVIGEPGKGTAHAGHVLAWGRTAMAAGCIGTAQAAIDATVAHVQTRHQFGKPIGQLEVVRDQVADIAWTNLADGVDLIFRSTAAKVLCSDANWEICDTAVQLHGGSGFIEETGIPLLLRDSRITRIFEGANDVLLTHMGSLEALAPRRPPTWMDEVDPALAKRANAYRARVAGIREELVQRHGVRLVRRARELHRLGQLVMLREAIDATVGRSTAVGTPAALALAARWLDIAASRAAAAELEADPAPVETITTALYEGASP
ncbi:MAG: acyl-CoA dehydrogenase family protein [Deltaproteobacteria bacterium]|nr:acyl-CoA dehydrogenase family protein [Deltaproteobacteria bacterium]